MWCVTRSWAPLFAALLLASACKRASPTSPSGAPECRQRTLGAMTAMLDGAPWTPVSTLAVGATDGKVYLLASDCTYEVRMVLERFRGAGTYEVSAGEVAVDLMCDVGRFCGRWLAGASFSNEVYGSGSVTVTGYSPPTPGVEGSGAIEGTFSFDLVPDLGANAPPIGAPAGTRTLTNGRFGSRFGAG